MGGGSRGLAHIGVLEVLERYHLKPDIVVGTSMGAIVGGFYACGVSTSEMRKMSRDPWLEEYFERPHIPFFARRANNFFDYFMVENYKTKLLKKIGFEQKDKIEEYFKNVVGELCIEELPFPFACNSLDLISGREVIFNQGKLYEALRASMSLPLVFEPVRSDDMLLVDGGLINNAPVDLAKKMGAGLTLVVDIHRSLKKIEAERIKNTFQLLQRTVETVLVKSNEERVKRADFVLRIEIETAILDFSHPSEIIEQGKQKAQENLPRLKNFFSKKT